MDALALADHGNLYVLKGWVLVLCLSGLLLWESIFPFVQLFGAGSGSRLRHLGLNASLGVINAVLLSGAAAILWNWAAGFSREHSIGVMHWVPVGEMSRQALGLVLFDGWMYGWHRLNHRVPFLWRFHRVHHSDPAMDVSTAHRFHVGEIFLSSLVRVPVLILLGLSIPALVVYETLLVGVTQFHHANIGLPGWLNRILEWVLVTPGLHKVHHSRVPVETDSNYGSILPVWDRIGGSFRTRPEGSPIRFGLDEFDSPPDQDLPGLIRMPYRTSHQSSGTIIKEGR